MDRDRFDALARSFAATATRRGALAALLAGVVAPLLPDVEPGLAKRGRGKRGGDGRGKGDGNGKVRGGGRGGQGRGFGNDRGRGKKDSPGNKRRQQKSKNRKPAERQAQAEAACYGGSPCIPGPGTNLGKCDFSGSSALKGKNLSGANLGGATVARGDASGANLQGANLDKTCLVDATLLGAKINGSTNIGGAVLCRTTMPDGSVSNAGCDRGTACCPTCDAAHPCPGGQVCCNGRCRSGDCCTDAQCANPVKPICLGFTCSPCTTNRQCGNGKVCCDGQCKSGNCCVAGDCADRPCQSKSCPNNQCAYAPLPNGTGCNADGNACTRNDACQGGSCVAGPAVVCTASDECHVAGVCDPATGGCSNPNAPNGTRCRGGAGECVAGVCEVTCRALGQTCASAAECCGPGARECSAPFIGNTPECCIPVGPGNACTVDSELQNSCCTGPDYVDENSGVLTSGSPGDCRAGSCCLGPASYCETTDQCCQTPGPTQCGVIPTCSTTQRPRRCCQPAGATCQNNICECCDGYCVDGRCSATCLPTGSRCQTPSECCSLVCDGVSGEGRCAA